MLISASAGSAKAAWVGEAGAGRPLIGVSASLHDFGDYGGVGVQRPIYAAGGTPVMLPQLPEAVDELVDRIDGLLLAPGRDIHPSRYGHQPDELLAVTEPRRDQFELTLTPVALERRLPVLGICRGMQMLNVALGGTMVQDVRLREAWRDHPSDPGWHAWKRMEGVALGDRDELPAHPRHAIEVVRPSILAGALGDGGVTVNSFHHQALDVLGEGLRVTAAAPDGVVEAIELDDADRGAWVLGVQWELQEEWRIDSRFTRVFDSFVAAAARRARRPLGSSGGRL